jgi:hypothetical protein
MNPRLDEKCGFHEALGGSGPFIGFAVVATPVVSMEETVGSCGSHMVFHPVFGMGYIHERVSKCGMMMFL